VAHGEQKGGFARTYTVRVTDGHSGKAISRSLGPESGGYPGMVHLGDVNGDRVADLLVGVPTGGSGGMVNYYLLTAARGRLAFLTAGEAPLSAPEFRIAFQRGYKVKVEDTALHTEVTLDLAQGADRAALAKTYQSVYSPDGQLLKPAEGWADRYGAMELQDLDGDGRAELVGYQQLWALFHANSFATARSVWRWSAGRLQLAEVKVASLYTPSQYFSDLGGLAVAHPARAVEKAVQLYHDRFATAPPAWREEAFLKFRDFHRTVADRANKAVQPKLEEAVRKAGPGQAFVAGQRLAEEVNRSEAYRMAGLALVYEGEGAWLVTAAEGFYNRQFGRWLSPVYRDFLALDDVEQNRRWAMDAAIVVSLEEVGRRLGAWEAYRQEYPDSPFALAAKRHYAWQLNAFLFGLDNTPHFDRLTKKVRPGVVEAFEHYRAANPGTPSAKLVAQVLRLYEKHNYVLDETLRRELNALSSAARP
jgi:hypothetical protein